MKIRAAVLREIGLPRPYAESTPLHIEELELGAPDRDEILVEIKAAGLCHSDLSVINGDRPRPVPMALGHEAAGVVRELGPGVTDLAVGDHVVMVFVPSCGHCRPCAEGRPALCEPGAAANVAGELLQGGRRLSRDGAPVHHHVGVSGFASHAVVSRRSAIKIDPSLSLTTAAMFGCAVLTGVGAVVNTAGVRPGSSVAVLGLGGVGLNALIGARMAGAAMVVAIDLLDSKLDLARQLGADAAFDAADPELVAKVKAATDGGVDTALEMAGSARALEAAYALTRRGGATVTAGLAHPDKDFSIKAVSLVAEERTVKGSYIGSCVPVRDLPCYIDLYRRGRLPIDALLSDTLALDEINLGFDRLAEGATVRQMVVF